MWFCFLPRNTLLDELSLQNTWVLLLIIWYLFGLSEEKIREKREAVSLRTAKMPQGASGLETNVVRHSPIPVSNFHLV